MRLIDGDALKGALERASRTMPCYPNTVMSLIDKAPTITRPKAMWKYHNDEHGVWWGCGNCGKILRRPPNDKLYCSRCGAEMTREA